MNGWLAGVVAFLSPSSDVSRREEENPL